MTTPPLGREAKVGDLLSRTAPIGTKVWVEHAEPPFDKQPGVTIGLPYPHNGAWYVNVEQRHSNGVFYLSSCTLRDGDAT